MIREDKISALKEAKKKLLKARLDLIGERTVETIKTAIVAIPLVLSGTFIVYSSKKLIFDREVKEPYTIEQVYDNDGNTSTKQTQDTEKHQNTLTVYDRYEKNDDGTYTRRYKVYDISKTAIEKIQKCLDQNDLDIDLRLISSGNETKKEINEEENHYYMVVHTYEKDKNNTYTREKTDEDLGTDIVRLLLSIGMISPAIGLSAGLTEFVEPDFYQDDEYLREKVKEAKEKVKSIKKR